MTNYMLKNKSKNKKIIEILKIKKSVLKILFLVHIIFLKSKIQEDLSEKSYCYILKLSMDHFLNKNIKNANLEKKPVNVHLKVGFFILILINDFYRDVKKDKVLDLNLHQINNEYIADYKNQKKKEPLNYTIQTVTYILKEEILKITEINLKMQYFESGINSIESLQSKLKKNIMKIRSTNYSDKYILESFEFFFFLASLWFCRF